MIELRITGSKLEGERILRPSSFSQEFRYMSSAFTKFYTNPVSGFIEENRRWPVGGRWTWAYLLEWAVMTEREKDELIDLARIGGPFSLHADGITLNRIISLNAHAFKDSSYFYLKSRKPFKGYENGKAAAEVKIWRNYQKVDSSTFTYIDDKTLCSTDLSLNPYDNWILEFETIDPEVVFMENTLRVNLLAGTLNLWSGEITLIET